MKKALLTIAILLFTGLSVDVLAQRKRSDDRKPRKEATLNNKNRNANNRDSRKNKVSNSRDKRNNRVYVKNNRRDNRVVRVVDRRVSRDRGWRNYGYSSTDRNSRRYYDFDSRRGRRILVNRGYRPSNRHIWLAGYWSYNPRIGRDVWIDGRWTIRRANHRWIAGHYQRVNGLRVWIDGCWTIRL
ncbi:hypothetical protein [Roseivirga sp.]|uniref:hypothetical protein n=1 Tax=Roseivirga sp. TaxID=1964215 RepID=UPI003B8DA7F2